MEPLIIQPIVEGHGEVDSVGILLRRMLAEIQIYNVFIKRPMRWPKSKLINVEELKKRVQLVWCRINYLTFGYLYGIIYA